MKKKILIFIPIILLLCISVVLIANFRSPRIVRDAKSVVKIFEKIKSSNTVTDKQFEEIKEKTSFENIDDNGRLMYNTSKMGKDNKELRKLADSLFYAYFINKNSLSKKEINLKYIKSAIEEINESLENIKNKKDA